MQPKRFDAQCARIKELAGRWIKPLGLGWWTIEHRYRDDPSYFRNEEKGTSVLMVCHVDWRYRTAAIDVNISLVQERGDEELEKDYVHELAHIFLNEMRMTATESDYADHEERVAQTLADAFIWIRDTDRVDARKEE